MIRLDQPLLMSALDWRVKCFQASGHSVLLSLKLDLSSELMIYGTCGKMII